MFSGKINKIGILRAGRMLFYGYCYITSWKAGFFTGAVFPAMDELLEL